MNKGKAYYSFSQKKQVKAVLFHEHYIPQRNTFLKNTVSCPAPTGVGDLTSTKGEELDLHSKHR